jgi:DNA-binding NtrC family response regulator
VRQLQHLVERLVALHAGGPISDADLELHINEAEQNVSPSAGKQPRSLLSYREEREAFEKEYLQRVLLAAKGNVSEAARLSGVARQNLYTRMKRLGIDTQS